MPPAAKDDEHERETTSQMPSGDEGRSPINDRRNFLRLALAAAVVVVTIGIGSVTRSLISPSVPPPEAGATTTSASATQTTTQSGPASPFPKLMVTNINDLAVGKSITFNYPLEETPNLLVKLGEKAQGGVGPAEDIVAFSQICQHLGCIYGYVGPGGSPSCDKSYSASGPVGYCCCHGSVYDLVNGAKVIAGPAPRPQPQVVLQYDSPSGDIYAVGMLPPTIFGHNTGSNNVLDDLQGGTPVS